MQHLALAALGALALGLVVSLTVVAAEPLYRTSQPDQLRLNVAWTLPGIRSKEFFRSCVIGLGMAAGHIGMVVLFYMVGSRFGVWAPQDIAYTDVVSTALPWLYPLTIGVYAATSEEFLFRLFAIPFLMRITRSRWLAVILPAFFWGFLHSTYPQEPGYIRGIEVGLIGIVAGVVMLRYGILATLVWHYTVDALLISLFLLRSGNLYFRVSGVLVGAGALIPLLVSGAFYLARRRFEPDEALLNRAEPLAEKPAAAPAAERVSQTVESLSPGRIRLLLGCGVAGVLLVALVRPQVVGDFLRFQVNARQVVAQADDILRAHAIHPERYHSVATLVPRSDDLANEFMRRKIGMAAVDRLYRERLPVALWRVRYFRDGEQEEYAVIIRPDGSFYSLHHTLEEKTPGAKLSREDAQARAEAYLRGEKRLELAQWKLMETNADARPARTDHTFVWEEIQPVAGGGADSAHVRMELKVQGDEVSGYRMFFKIPEAWERQQTEQTLPRVLSRVWRVVFFAALGVAVLVLFFKNLRQQTVPWRRLAKWALVVLAGTVLTTADNLPQILANYATAMPLKIYAAVVGVSVFVLVLFSFVMAFFLLGLAWFFLARALGEDRIPGWRGMPASYHRDALVIGLGGTATLAGLARLGQIASQAWPTLARSLDAAVPTGFDSYWPAALSVGGALSSGLLLTAGVGLAAGFVACYLPKPWMRCGLLVAASLALVSNWGSPADFAKRLLLQLVLLGVFWFGVQKVVRFNLIGYFLLAALPGLASAANVLLKQPNTFLRLNGVAVVGTGLALLAWPLLSWLTAEAPATGAGPQASA